MKRFDFLIVGNSIAAVGAVEAIRSGSDAGPIGVIADEPYHVYSRPRINEVLTKNADAMALAYRPADFYAQRSVTPMLDQLAICVDSEKKRVTLKNKRSIEYGKLLLTTGARPVRPLIPGIELQGVHFFTTYDEVTRLSQDLEGVREAVVIGSGPVGLEAAEALCKVGVKPTVVEMLDRPLALALDECASALVCARFEQNGITFRVSSRVIEMLSDSNGRVSAVTLDDGSKLDAQVVVVAAGVSPRTELAESAGIRAGRGFVVDDLMQTTGRDIYAGGDAAEGSDLLLGGHRVIPVWPNAYMQGRTAGMAMIGRRNPFAGGISMNSARFFELAVVSAGVIDHSDDCTDLVEVNERTGYYRRIILKDDVPVGLVMLGDAVERAGLVLSLIRNKNNVSSFKDKLASPDFSIAHLPEELREIKKAGKEKV